MEREGRECLFVFRIGSCTYHHYDVGSGLWAEQARGRPQIT